MIENTRVGAVILAAGQGKRMKSELPKVMHLLNGKPLVEHVWKNVRDSGCFFRIVVVVPKDNNLVKNYLAERAEYAVQVEQLGTGHATLAAEGVLDNEVDDVAVFYGDMPFLKPDSIKKLVEKHKMEKATITLLTASVSDFDGWQKAFWSFGRVIRDEKGLLSRVVEYKDATPEELGQKEISTCFFCFQADWLWNNLKELKNENVQEEYYLPDLIKLAISQGKKITIVPINCEEALGVNSQDDLKIAESVKKYEE